MHQGRCLRTALAAGLLLAIAGCAIDSPPSSADLQRAALPHTVQPANWKGGGQAAPLAERWLAAFDDAALSALVAEALAYNADLQIAAARVEQAAGALQVASSPLLPTVGVLGTYSANPAGAAR